MNKALFILAVISLLMLVSCSKERPYKTLDDYYSSIDLSCEKDKDCVINDISSCCGYYPQCTHKKAKTDPEFVITECTEEQIAQNCGFDPITDCQCVDNMCVAVIGVEVPEEIQKTLEYECPENKILDCVEIDCDGEYAHWARAVCKDITIIT